MSVASKECQIFAAISCACLKCCFIFSMSFKCGSNAVAVSDSSRPVSSKASLAFAYRLYISCFALVAIFSFVDVVEISQIMLAV